MHVIHHSVGEVYRGGAGSPMIEGLQNTTQSLASPANLAVPRQLRFDPRAGLVLQAIQVKIE
jgi:hypothetical protein